LRYRGKKSLGWVPLKGRNIKETKDGFHFHGREFRVFKSRDLPSGARITDGTNFSRDARGNWFLNVCVEYEQPEQRQMSSGVGIDLGLKSFADLSTGETIDNPRHFRAFEEKLGKAQRARKKRRAASIHARIANSRRDFLHKLSHRIVREFDYIAVGNVSASKLAKTNMAKSVADAGWSSFRAMLAYKAIKHGAWFEEVNESFSSQVCSSCGTLPDSRPKGITDLGVRQWVCSGCGVAHDRDTNAALNILARHGHVPPVEGIPVL
jgi:IS605 OrfB family transposase